MSIGPEPLGVFGYPQPGATAALSLRQDEDTNMKLSAMLESKYIKQADLEQYGGECVVTIEGLKKVNVARDDEAPEYKWTIKFKEFPKSMVLNATNAKRIGKLLGDETDDWKDGQVTLFVDENVAFGSDIVGGLRIKAARNPAAKARQALNVDDVNRKLADAEMKDDIPF